MFFESVDLTTTERPIFGALINHVTTVCLLDTGAILPVFCGTPNEFTSWVPHGQNTTVVGEIIIKGFGYTQSEAVVYNIPEFVLSDGKNSVTYINMRIAIVDSPDTLPFTLILPATMFQHMRYAIDTVAHPCKVILEPVNNPMTVRYDNDTNGIYINVQNNITLTDPVE